MTCKHENADHLQPGDWFNLDEVPQYVVKVEQFRCIDCAAWLPLGKAAKADPVEIAAARLVAGHHDANDTDDDLKDPLVRECISEILDPPAPRRTKRGRLVDRLYVAATELDEDV